MVAVEEHWPAMLRTSSDVNFVMFRVLVLTPMLPISVEPSTKRYDSHSHGVFHSPHTLLLNPQMNKRSTTQGKEAGFAVV